VSLNNGPRGNPYTSIISQPKKNPGQLPRAPREGHLPSHRDHEHSIKVMRGSASVVPVKIEIVTINYHLASGLVLTMVGLALS